MIDMKALDCDNEDKLYQHIEIYIEGNLINNDLKSFLLISQTFTQSILFKYIIWN